MAGFSFPAADNTPRYADTGTGPNVRLRSWADWTAAPYPLMVPEQGVAGIGDFTIGESEIGGSPLPTDSPRGQR